MPTILKREFAPVSDQAWGEIDKEAARTIKLNLVGRRLVDFSGPHGWELGSVNLGRVDLASKKSKGAAPWGTRAVLPLVELRLPFVLPQMEIDNLNRGAEDVDLDPVQEAAEKGARFEDEAVFGGFAEGNITGITKASAHKAVKLPGEVTQYPAAVADALKAISAAGIEGPYALVLGPDNYYKLMQSAKPGYPPHRTIEEMLGGDILRTPVMGSDGLVISTRGGDFELTVGKDFSVGYASHDREAVEFFITESFTFRVIEPRAAVTLKPGR